MSDVADLLSQIYPLIQKDADSIFSEFKFREIPNGWEATGGEIHGVKAAGHLYYYENTPFCFKNHQNDEVITIWDYVKESRGIIEKRDIFRELANMAHFTLPELDKNTIDQIKKREEGDSLKELFLLFTQDELWKDGGKESLDYLHNKRGYVDDDIKGMELGHNPGWKATEEYLLSKEYTQAQINNELKYLRSRDGYPVIIPQRDSQGRLTALWGRRVKLVPEGEKDKRKYLPINDARGSKSIPFNLKNVRGLKTVVGVEGIFDCLFPAQREFHGIIGWGQVSPTNNQLDTLRQMGIREVILIPDNDDKGQNGVERGLHSLARKGLMGYVAELPPDCKDVDEFTVKYGVEKLGKITSNPISGAHWKGTRLAEKYDLGSDVDQKRALDEFLSYQASLKNPLDRKHAVEGFRVGLDLPEGELRELVEEHCQRVTDHNRRAGIVSSCQRIIGMAREGQSFDEITKELQGLSSPLEVRRGEVEPVPFNLDVALEQITTMPEARVTGYHSLDMNARIVVPSLVVVGARTGHGKTTWGINQLRKMLDAEENREFPFIFFSLEVPQNLFSAKLLGAETGQDIQEVIKDIKMERWTEEMKEAIEKYRGYREDDRFFLVSERGMSIESVSSYCREVRDEFGQVGGVFVDYIGLLTSKEENQNIERQYAKVITGLNDMAHEIQCPVIAFSQMNRESVKGKGNKKQTARYPKIHELRYSGQIEQEADQVWGLFNITEDKYQVDLEEAEEIEGGACLRDEYSRSPIAHIRLLSLKDRYWSGFNPIDFRMENGVRIEEWTPFDENSAESLSIGGTTEPLSIDGDDPPF